MGVSKRIESLLALQLAVLKDLLSVLAVRSWQLCEISCGVERKLVHGFPVRVAWEYIND